MSHDISRTSACDAYFSFLVRHGNMRRCKYTTQHITAARNLHHIFNVSICQYNLAGHTSSEECGICGYIFGSLPQDSWGAMIHVYGGGGRLGLFIYFFFAFFFFFFFFFFFVVVVFWG